MRLVALLSARTPAAGSAASTFAADDVRIGVHLPVEHQARQALLAGADQLVIRSDLPSPELARAVDRLARESAAPVLLVGDGPDLGRHVEPEDRVLMFGEQMILPQSAIEDLIASDAPALLVTPTEPPTAHFERIDGNHVWAGGALFAGETLLGTIDMLGEWDLELTLLRRTVQQQARRVEIPVAMAASGLLARIGDRTDADRALEALSQSGLADEGGRDGLSMLLAPVGRALVSMLSRYQVNPAQLGWVSGMSAIFALAAGSASWPKLGLLLALLSEAALALGDGCARVMLRHKAHLWLNVLVKGSSLALLTIIGSKLTGNVPLALSGVGLPLALIATQTIADARDRRPAAERPGPWLRITTAMTLAAVLAGAVGGRTADAFLLIGLCAFGTVAGRLLAAEEKRI